MASVSAYRRTIRVGHVHNRVLRPVALRIILGPLAPLLVLELMSSPCGTLTVAWGLTSRHGQRIHQTVARARRTDDIR
jgi:hypothetical protein